MAVDQRENTRLTSIAQAAIVGCARSGLFGPKVVASHLARLK
jgi:hypothetical protein